jgi:hypothetical protein
MGFFQWNFKGVGGANNARFGPVRYKNFTGSILGTNRIKNVVVAGWPVISESAGSSYAKPCPTDGCCPL